MDKESIELSRKIAIKQSDDSEAGEWKYGLMISTEVGFPFYAPFRMRPTEKPSKEINEKTNKRNNKGSLKESSQEL